MTELDEVARFLRSHSTLALATVSAEGAPRAAALFYLFQDDWRLYWFSSTASEHSRNLKRDRAAAVSVYRPTADWRKIRGVQMRGTATPVTGRTLRRLIIRAYVERFRLGTLFRFAMARSTLYCFQPEWLRYIDNSKRFGYKFEIALPAPSGDRTDPA
jgi:uncharacterized protein